MTDQALNAAPQRTDDEREKQQHFIFRPSIPIYCRVFFFSGGRLHAFSYQAQAGRLAGKQSGNKQSVLAEDSVERDLSPPANNNCDRWCCGGRRKRKSKVHRSLKWMLAGAAAAASAAAWWKAVGVVGVGAIVLEDLHHHPTPKLDKSISSFMMIWTESPGSDQHK